MCRFCRYSTRVDRRRTVVVGPVVAFYLDLSIVGMDREMVVVVLVGTLVVVDNLAVAFRSVVPVIFVASDMCRKDPALVGLVDTHSSVSGMLVMQPDALEALERLPFAEVDYRHLPVLLHCRHSDVSRRRHHPFQPLLALLVVGC